MLDIFHDSNGNAYVETANLRITWIHKAGEADWARTGTYLRISAYRDGTSNRLHQGAEMPINAGEDVADLVRAITHLAIARSAQN